MFVTCCFPTLQCIFSVQERGTVKIITSKKCSPWDFSFKTHPCNVFPKHERHALLKRDTYLSLVLGSQKLSTLTCHNNKRKWINPPTFLRDDCYSVVALTDEQFHVLSDLRKSLRPLPLEKWISKICSLNFFTLEVFCIPGILCEGLMVLWLTGLVLCVTACFALRLWGTPLQSTLHFQLFPHYSHLVSTSINNTWHTCCT